MRIRRSTLVCFWIAFVLPVWAEAARAGSKVDCEAGQAREALIVANWKYKHEQDLVTPQHDANAVARVLRSLEFNVVVAENLVQGEQWSTMECFFRRSGASQVRLLYYVGHGMHTFYESKQATGYLLATDFNPREDAVRGLTIKSIVRWATEKPTKTVVVIDACRTMPRLAATWQQVRGDAPFDPPGPGIPQPRLEVMPENLLLAFSTSIGKPARDSGNGKLSVFGESFSKRLAEREKHRLKLSETLDAIKREVEQATQGQQVPVWVAQPALHECLMCLSND